jgi:hypothetical protein
MKIAYWLPREGKGSRPMKIGGLYSYSDARDIYPESNDYLEAVATIKRDEPFVLLEMKVVESWGQYFKILTIEGIVGWAFIGYPDQVKEVIYDG